MAVKRQSQTVANMAEEQPNNSRDSFSTQSDQTEKFIQTITELLSSTVDTVSTISAPFTQIVGELNDRVVTSVNDIFHFFFSSVDRKK